MAKLGGKILTITSVHDSIPSPGRSPYGAAKGGLLALTRSLTLELAAQRINVIAPGPTPIASAGRASLSMVAWK